uniref:histidine kinase n=1 Tax=Caldilinea aerophila TaxID=133453 RepID=A0A7C1FTM7_9CHLR
MATFFRRSLNARLIAVVAGVVLFALMAANAAAFLILRNQLEQQSQNALALGERTALFVLDERMRTLNALAVVLSQRPTLQRLLRDKAYAELSDFLDDFRIQGDLDWVVACSRDGAILSASNLPQGESVCSLPGAGYWHVGGSPTLVGIGEVPGQDRSFVMIAQEIDATFLKAVASASGLEHGLVSDGERLVATWLVPTAVGQVKGVERLVDANGVQHLVRYAAIKTGASTLLLESALPIFGQAAAERRTLILLTVSTLITAAVVIVVAVLGVRLVNAPIVAVLQRSADALSAAEAERVSALESLDTLIQSIVEGVIMTDDKGVVQFFSAGAERILKLSAENAIGMRIEQLLQNEEGELFSGETLLAAPGASQLLELRTCTGERITVAVSATRIGRPGEARSVNAYLVRDVTEEEALQRLRSYFLASISHEFRTPLSALRASLELLVNEENPLDLAESRQLLRPAYLSVVGLQTLIDNLLISSAIEAGRFSLHFREVDLRVILADAVRVVMPLLERRQQPLIVELPATPVLVRGDAVHLTQALVNLLTNAGKYSPVGSPVEVTISLRIEGKDEGKEGESAPQRIVRVAVADKGPGVDPALRSEIFRRFVRRHDSEREQYGVGLGLYVAKTAITAHGGSIDVENHPEGGSLFWFELKAI